MPLCTRSTRRRGASTESIIINIQIQLFQFLHKAQHRTWPFIFLYWASLKWNNSMHTQWNSYEEKLTNSKTFYNLWNSFSRNHILIDQLSMYPRENSPIYKAWSIIVALWTHPIYVDTPYIWLSLPPSERPNLWEERKENRLKHHQFRGMDASLLSPSPMVCKPNCIRVAIDK